MIGFLQFFHLRACGAVQRVACQCGWTAGAAESHDINTQAPPNARLPSPILLLTKMSSKKRILIVGGGAAGMSCAATLSNHPSQFTITLIEREQVVGGQATSASLDSERYGADFLNDGVQGGSEIFAHTFRFFRQMGYEPSPVDLQISFARGKDGFWGNVFPSQLISEFGRDIRRFGWVLKVVHWFEIIFSLVPVWLLLRIFLFSKRFGDRMVYPLMALFLGTGICPMKLA
jgi:NAD(P)-binding Rossmann-like domain